MAGAHVRRARRGGAWRAAARLERLAADADDNVRHAALGGCARCAARRRRDLHRGAGAPRLSAGPARRAGARGSPNGATAVPALLEAFARLTAERRDTSRDPRMALLAAARARLAAQAPALRCCLTDIDPVVAAECAATLRPGPARPTPPRRRTRDPAPSHGRAARAADRCDDGGGRAIELRLLADEAPASVARFAELARQGYYNGLTFCRVAPGLRPPGRQSRRQRVRRRRPVHARRARAALATRAARSACRRAAATPATRRSSSTCSTTRASITTSPCSARSRPAWTWSTRVLEGDVIDACRDSM